MGENHIASNTMRDSPYIRILGLVGTTLMILALINTILYMIAYGGPQGYLFIRVEFPLLGSYYSPAAYNVLTEVALYFIFYTKFRARSIFMFAFLWGTEDLVAIAEYSLYRIIEFHGTGVYTLGARVFWESAGIDALAASIGLIVLRPRLNLRLTVGKVVSILLIVIGSGYTVVTSTIGYNNYSNVLLNIVSYMAILGLLLLLYQIFERRDARPTESNRLDLEKTLFD